MFQKFGNILSCKIVTHEDGKSKGYGFVQFGSEESADAAIEKLNGIMAGEKQLYEHFHICCNHLAFHISIMKILDELVVLFICKFFLVYLFMISCIDGIGMWANLSKRLTGFRPILMLSTQICTSRTWMLISQRSI